MSEIMILTNQCNCSFLIFYCSGNSLGMTLRMLSESEECFFVFCLQVISVTIMFHDIVMKRSK